MDHLRPHQSHPHQHFLIVTITAQGQINPARHLARLLAQTAGPRVTIATPVSSHRLLFPSSTDGNEQAIVDQGTNVSYAAYSDGFDQGFHPEDGDTSHYIAKIKLVGSQTLAVLARTLADHGRPITCIIYTLLTDWASAVAVDLGVPSVLFWIQPASVFSVFYHYFHGYAVVITAHRNDPSFTLNLPGLPPLEIRDLPSMLTAEPSDPLLDSYGDIMKTLERQEARSGGRSVKPRVLMNTFHALEADVIEAMDHLNLIPVGPMIETNASAAVGKDLFERDTSEYMEWLNSKEERSVVYISFGSLSRFSRVQMEEMSRGLKESGRRYLWVVRRDVREKESDMVDRLTGDANEGNNKVIEWCDQVRVLRHRSTGCFVTHCGWNSITESIVCGVPMVMLPQRMDQATNAKLVEGVWGTGVRAELSNELGGVVEGRELRRCLDVVMGGGERGVGIRRKTEIWREKAREAVADDGSSVRSLAAFLDGM